MADRVQDPRRAKRSAAAQEGAVESSDFGGDRTRKAAEASNGIEHYLTLVR
jgi:hypothetical protein